MEKKFLWMWLKTVYPFSDTVVYKLLDLFGDIERIYSAGEESFNNVKDLKKERIRKLCDKSLDRVYRIYENAKRLGAEVYCIDDEEYPERLRNIHNPPPVIYVRGDLSCLESDLVISGVGTRECNDYGANTAKLISARLAEAGAVLVSGMAVGIDSAVHTGALAVGGKTVAILATPFNRIYPKENKNLYRRICENGLVISEYPPGYSGGPWDFHLRNRMIAGVADGVFVCQAPIKSGSLITAGLALDMGRDLFCVAGNAEAINAGSNDYIMKGNAKMIVCAEDILAEYGIKKTWPKESVPKREVSASKKESAPIREGKDYSCLTPVQQKIVKLAGAKTLHANDICEALNIGYGALAAELTQLELMDIIENKSGIITLK